MRRPLFCVNPKCGEVLARPAFVCDSCRLIGSIGVFVGGILGGALAAVVSYLLK